MRTFITYTFILSVMCLLVSCNKDQGAEPTNRSAISLHFSNTFQQTPIVLGDAGSSEATMHISAMGQVHYFSELKYVISNIRLVQADGQELAYHTADLDQGAILINQANPESLDFLLRDIPVGEYQQIKFGLGVPAELNVLDEVKFPEFYAEVEANNTEMMWEWGTGYRFVKIEGFFGPDRQPLSVHTGSTVTGTNGEPDSYIQGVDAYRDIVLDLPVNAVVGSNSPRITIQADFDKLLSGQENTIVLSPENAQPNAHHTLDMLKFVNNLGGDGTSDQKGMFSVEQADN